MASDDISRNCWPTILEPHSKKDLRHICIFIVRAPPPAADPGDLYFSREAGKQDRSPPIRNAIDQFNCSFIYKRRFPPIEV